MVGREQQIPDDELHLQNAVMVMLSYALLGAISSNFRMVALNLKENPWVVWIVLNHDNAEDRAEIEEIGAEFWNQLLSVKNPGFEMRVTIDSGEFLMPTYPWLALFRQKE